MTMDLRQRALSERVRVGREALAAASSFNGSLQAWHSKIARLRVLANRSGKDAEMHDDLRDEADLLARSISDQREAFAEAVATLPPAVASNERITDTDKALANASAAVEENREILARS
jgi:hypothetical protein